MSKYVTQTGTLVADEEDDFSYDKVDVQAVVPGNAHLEQPDDKLDLIVRNTLTTRSADEQGEKKKQENVASAGTVRVSEHKASLQTPQIYTHSPSTDIGCTCDALPDA